MQVHLISIRPVYFICPVNLNYEQNFELKRRIKLKTSKNFKPQLLRWQVSCPAHNVLGFERGVKEAIRPKGPTLKRDGGRYNLPSAPVCGTTFLLKCRTGRGAEPGPINNDVIVAHYAHDTTPASA